MRFFFFFFDLPNVPKKESGHPKIALTKFRFPSRSEHGASFLSVKFYPMNICNWKELNWSFKRKRKRKKIVKRREVQTYKKSAIKDHQSIAFFPFRSLCDYSIFCHWHRLPPCQCVAVPYSRSLFLVTVGMFP